MNEHSASCSLLCLTTVAVVDSDVEMNTGYTVLASTECHIMSVIFMSFFNLLEWYLQ